MRRLQNFHINVNKKRGDAGQMYNPIKAACLSCILKKKLWLFNVDIQIYKDTVKEIISQILGADNDGVKSKS